MANLAPWQIALAELDAQIARKEEEARALHEEGRDR